MPLASFCVAEKQRAISHLRRTTLWQSMPRVGAIINWSALRQLRPIAGQIVSDRSCPEADLLVTPVLTQWMVRPCITRGFVELEVGGLASMYPAFDRSV